MTVTVWGKAIANVEIDLTLTPEKIAFKKKQAKAETATGKQTLIVMNAFITGVMATSLTGSMPPGMSLKTTKPSDVHLMLPYLDPSTEPQKIYFRPVFEKSKPRRLSALEWIAWETNGTQVMADEVPNKAAKKRLFAIRKVMLSNSVTRSLLSLQLPIKLPSLAIFLANALEDDHHSLEIAWKTWNDLIIRSFPLEVWCAQNTYDLEQLGSAEESSSTPNIGNKAGPADKVVRWRQHFF